MRLEEDSDDDTEFPIHASPTAKRRRAMNLEVNGKRSDVSQGRRANRMTLHDDDDGDESGGEYQGNGRYRMRSQNASDDEDDEYDHSNSIDEGEFENAEVDEEEEELSEDDEDVSDENEDIENHSENERSLVESIDVETQTNSKKNNITQTEERDGTSPNKESPAEVPTSRKKLEIIIGLAPPPPSSLKRGRGRPRKYPVITASIPGQSTPLRSASSMLNSLRNRNNDTFMTPSNISGDNGISGSFTEPMLMHQSRTNRRGLFSSRRQQNQMALFKKIPLMEEMWSLLNGSVSKAEVDTSKCRPEPEDVAEFKEAARNALASKANSLISSTGLSNFSSLNASTSNILEATKPTSNENAVPVKVEDSNLGEPALFTSGPVSSSQLSLANALLLEKRDPLAVPPRIRKILFGKHEINTWYSAPYPEEYLSKEGSLWICDHCFKYMNSRRTLESHREKCVHSYPPGNEIYRHGKLSIFEINGKHNKMYCQNLCLFAKMFLDHKTLYYDVEPFFFYVLTEWDEEGCHFIGYFSKEKQSPSNYNVSCILTMPTSQRKGYGHFLIDFSYLLSKKEGKPGSPEKPLSELGFLSYKKYWTSQVRRVLVNHEKDFISIQDITARTMMTTDDVIMAFEWLDCLKKRKVGPGEEEEYVLCVDRKRLKDEVLIEDSKPRLDAVMEYLKWDPYLSLATADANPNHVADHVSLISSDEKKITV